LSGQSVADGAGRYFKCVLNATGASQQVSTADRGYRTTGSLTYQWQMSAADSDADYSNLSGATTASYNATEAPGDGSGRYFKCVIDATGASQQTSSADRGYVKLITISGTVVLSSTGVENAKVYLIKQTTEEVLATTLTNGDGEYSFDYTDGVRVDVMHHLVVEYESGGVKYNAANHYNVEGG